MSEAEIFTYRIEFRAEPPAFIVDDWTVSSITCTEKDTEWSVVLPQVTQSDISPVQVQLLNSTDLFELSGDLLRLKSSFDAENCPPTDSIDLEFELTSILLGKN